MANPWGDTAEEFIRTTGADCCMIIAANGAICAEVGEEHARSAIHDTDMLNMEQTYCDIKNGSCAKNGCIQIGKQRLMFVGDLDENGLHVEMMSNVGKKVCVAATHIPHNQYPNHSICLISGMKPENLRPVAGKQLVYAKIYDDRVKNVQQQ